MTQSQNLIRFANNSRGSYLDNYTISLLGGGGGLLKLKGMFFGEVGIDLHTLLPATTEEHMAGNAPV